LQTPRADHYNNQTSKTWPTATVTLHEVSLNRNSMSYLTAPGLLLTSSKTTVIAGVTRAHLNDS